MNQKRSDVRRIRWYRDYTLSTHSDRAVQETASGGWIQPPLLWAITIAYE